MIQANDWTLRQETVLTPLKLPETEQEQSVELDYVLPDYCPDFFRLLSCTAETAVTAGTPADGAVPYTLHVTLRVLYCGAQTGAVQALTQTLDYQGRAELPAAAAGASALQIRMTAEPSYLNCRAVSQRRIDIRGAVKLRTVCIGEQPRTVLSGAEGLHVRTRAEPFSYVSQLLRTEKRFTLSDDIRLTDAQPALLSVLQTQSALTVTETRIVAGKLVVKGEAAVTLLYTAENGIETHTAALPFSQIVEQDGLADDMTCIVTARAAGLILTPESGNDGDIRLLHTDLDILLDCAAVRQTTADLLTDLYSTVHPAEPLAEQVTLLTMPAPVSERYRQKLTLTQQDAVITKVYAAWAEPESLRTAAEDGGTVISGTLHGYVLAADAESHPLMLEQRAPFSWTLPARIPAEGLPPVTVQSCSYTLTGSDSVTLQTELLLSGQVLQQTVCTLLTDAQIDPETRLPDGGQYALRLYFGQAGESLWEIAKRYRTAESAIREENDVPADTLTAPQMLLIPSVL